MVWEAVLERPMQETGTVPSLALLFDTHALRFYRLARRLTRNREDAEDLVQETFLRAADAAAGLPAGANAEEAWLVRGLVNLAKDRWRRSAVRARASGTLEGDPPGLDPEPAQGEGKSRNLLNTNFTMAVGETVVAGTSRLDSGEALVVVLTALPPSALR